jgi:hypothetical protein
MGVTVQKTKYEGIYKQQEGILLNTDNDALKAYKARKEKDRKAVSIEKDVEMLKTGMEEIKELLMKVLAK